MKREDLERLTRPYPTAKTGQPAPDLALALGWRVVSWRDLLKEVRSDLDSVSFGIGWWKQAAEADDDLRRRIVVSDYLVSLIEGAEHALIDLELHRLELLDYLDREGKFLRDALAVSNGAMFVAMPPRRSAADELAPAFVDLHLAGLLRAAATAFDCVAGVIVVVGAVELGVLRTDWGKVAKKFQALPSAPVNSAVTLQRSLKAAMDGVLAGSAAANWHEWVQAYRNLVVHRGHRLKLSHVAVVPTLYDGRGRRVVRAEVSPVLASDPEVTDMEAFGMAHHHSPVLEEDARRTMDGVVDDLRRLMNEMGSALLKAWCTRRASPATIVQPLLKQWPTVRRSKQHFFPGYRPGSMPFNPASMTANPNYVKRMEAGALAVPDNALWRRS